MPHIIRLYIQPDIPGPAWEEAWQQCLSLLKTFPVRLFRIENRLRTTGIRSVLTSDLVASPGKIGEAIIVQGDLGCLLHADAFTLFRDLKACPNFQKPVNAATKILDAPSRDCSDPRVLNAECLCEGETLGYPYHLAIIATGILLENLFPEKVICHGKIDRISAEIMRKWVESKNDKPAPQRCSRPMALGLKKRGQELSVQPLLCSDAGRLLKMLKTTFPRKEKQVQRFRALYLGSPAETIAALLAHLNLSRLRAIFALELSQFEAWKSEARQILWAWFEATRNLDETIRLFFAAREACTLEQIKKSYHLSELLQALCYAGTLISMDERTPCAMNPHYSGYAPPMEDPLVEVLDALLSDVFCATIPYVPGEEVLKTFLKYEPGNEAAFSKIISAEEKGSREYLKDLRGLVEKWEEECLIEFRDLTGLPPEEYVLSQIGRQKRITAGLEEKMFRELTTLQNDVQAGKQRIRICDDEGLRREIEKVCQKNSIALTEEVWNWIDCRASNDTLHFIRFFAAIENSDLQFRTAQKFILNHLEFMERCFAATPPAGIRRQD